MARGRIDSLCARAPGRHVPSAMATSMPDEVFHDEEAQDRIAHRQLHVLEARLRDRAEERVQDQPDQQLHIQAVREESETHVIDGQPRAPRRDTSDCPAKRGDTGQDNEPPKP